MRKWDAIPRPGGVLPLLTLRVGHKNKASEPDGSRVSDGCLEEEAGYVGCTQRNAAVAIVRTLP